MNNFFYRTYDTTDHIFMNDPRGYLSPYVDADMEGETEHQVFMTKYMRMKNSTNHIFKIRCNDQSHGRL